MSGGEMDEIEIDRFPVEGVLEWQDEDGASWLWLVGGDQEDVEAFLDDLEEDSRR